MPGLNEKIENKSIKYGITFFGGLDTSTKCRFSSYRMTFSTKSGHRSLVPTPFTYLVVLKSNDCWNKLVPFLIEIFFGGNKSRDLICICN